MNHMPCPILYRFSSIGHWNPMLSMWSLNTGGAMLGRLNRWWTLLSCGTFILLEVIFVNVSFSILAWTCCTKCFSITIQSNPMGEMNEFKSNQCKNFFPTFDQYLTSHRNSCCNHFQYNKIYFHWNQITRENFLMKYVSGFWLSDTWTGNWSWVRIYMHVQCSPTRVHDVNLVFLHSHIIDIINKFM